MNHGSEDIPCYSAGHTKHEWTSWACIDALFPYLEEKYAEFVKDGQSDESQSDEENDAVKEKVAEEKVDEEKVNEKKADAQTSDQEDTNDQNKEEEAEGKSDQENVDVKTVQETADVKGEHGEESPDDGQSEPKKPNKREDL